MPPRASGSRRRRSFGRRGSNANADGFVALRKREQAAAVGFRRLGSWRPSVGGRRASRAAAAVPAEADQRGNPCRSNQQSRRPVPLPAASRPPARLLDQRLQVGDTLLEVAILLDLRPAGGVVTVTATPHGMTLPD